MSLESLISQIIPLFVANYHDFGVLRIANVVVLGGRSYLFDFVDVNAVFLGIVVIKRCYFEEAKGHRQLPIVDSHPNL